MKENSINEMDLRWLEPPRPLQEALTGVYGLKSGNTLRIHTRFRPVFLIEQLASGEFEVSSEEAGADHWLTTITKK